MTNSSPNEYTVVELPLIEQLKSMSWQHIRGDIHVPDFTERTSFREVLLYKRLYDALRRINLDDTGQPWLDDLRISLAVGALERLGANKLIEANQVASDLLLRGIPIEGDPVLHQGREQTVRYIDFEHPERNDFLVINQFRVDHPGGQQTIIPDLVLFVNGIPLVVIECKSPAITDPMQEGITQLLRYSNQRDWIEGDEGVERLFHYNQLLISTYFYEARVASIGASYEHFQEWKDTSPVPMAEVAASLGVSDLKSQHILVAGMLRPAHLLDIVRNFTLFQQSGGQTMKIIPRYQQFRAVYEAIRRLQHNQTRAQHGEADQRGGIIWHTQGSGKSLTMVFLVRKMRTLLDLRRFKIVVVTDRIDLEKQLKDTATLTGDVVRRATKTEELKAMLREEGADLFFAMIQKYQEHELQSAGGAGTPGISKEFPILNESEYILVLVDEAHRSQASDLHANLMQALPNCAKIGFTGTPIIMGEKKKTHEIFGTFIDCYTIQQSEWDGSTVPILYEGRTAEAAVAEGRTLDELFEDMFKERTPEELEALKAKYATEGNVLEAPKLIAAKAENMLRHYIDTVLPNGLKAMIIATSRLAAVRYQEALVAAHENLVERLERLDVPSLPVPGADAFEQSDQETQFLVRAHAHLATIRRLAFAAVISGDGQDDPSWRTWSDKAQIDARIERFKKPLLHEDPARQDGMAFLCVKSMLITGFDVHVLQALYLDRFMQDYELLQAIARVNRPYDNKSNGLVVDYYGVARHLKEALAAYSAEDIQGTLTSIKDQLPVLKDRHRRVVAVFLERGIRDLDEVDACIDLLRDPAIRHDFSTKLKQFLASLDVVLPRPEALPYVRDAKRLGYINKSASNLYRDPQLQLLSAGHKVRELIDQHIIALGVEPTVPPISILDPEFERAVEGRASDQAKASEMEHAARFYIDRHYGEDPVYYQRLSERLEEILQRFQDNWAAMAEALRSFTSEVRQGRPQDETGLDPRTQAPFLGILAEASSAGHPLSREQLSALAALTVEMVDHIRQEVRAVDFWRNAQAQHILRGWLIHWLDDHNVIPFQQLPALADRLMELARALHTRLMA